MKDFEKYLDEIKKIALEEGYDSLDETYVEHLKARYFGQDVVIGRSHRVTIREMKTSDLEAFYGFADAGSEEVLQTFLKETKEESKAHLQAYIENMYPLYDHGIWAVELNDTKEVIGLCGVGITEIDGTDCTDLGYYICPKWRKQGIATECIEIVLDYVKNYLEFGMIYAIIKEENRISKDILRKFGFQFLKTSVKSGDFVSVYKKSFKEQQ